MLKREKKRLLLFFFSCSVLFKLGWLQFFEGAKGKEGGREGGEKTNAAADVKGRRIRSSVARDVRVWKENLTRARGRESSDDLN